MLDMGQADHTTELPQISHPTRHVEQRADELGTSGLRETIHRIEKYLNPCSARRVRRAFRRGRAGIEFARRWISFEPPVWVGLRPALSFAVERAPEFNGDHVG